MSQKKFTTKKSGFTLIEVVIALAILGLVIATIVYVGNQSYKIAREAKHRLSAMGWSQQGLNSAQKVRDENLLANPSTPFKNFSLDPSNPEGTYYMNNDVLTYLCPSTLIDDSNPNCAITSAGQIISDNRTFTQKIVIKKVP